MDPLTPGQVVGVRVKEHRDLHGLTQAQLAERLRSQVGWSIDRSLLARIEAGERQVTVDELFKLAAVLDTTPVLLMTPADESDLMQPLPWRPMTSSRVRAWVSDSVPLWEQDRNAYTRASDAAWERTNHHQQQMESLLDRVAALYGVESIEDVDPDAELPELSQAMVDVLNIEIELEMRRHEWGQYVGHWKWEDERTAIDLFERHPRFTSEAAIAIFGKAALHEIHKRHEDLRSSEITNAAEVAERVRRRIENVVEVMDALRAAVNERLSSATPKKQFERPQGRPTGENPA